MELISTVEKAVSHYRETGKFVVVYTNSVKAFDNLIDAFKFYYCLNRAATLWDVTETAELLEEKRLVLDSG